MMVEGFNQALHRIPIVRFQEVVVPEDPNFVVFLRVFVVGCDKMILLVVRSHPSLVRS